MRKNSIIAIDGPAGVGKSTIGKLVAKKLGYKFINSGILYRALAWKALKNNIDLKDVKKIVELARKTKWKFETGRATTLKVYADGVFIYNQIRCEKVANASSVISQDQSIRDFIVLNLKKLAENRSIVMEGRDIGTFVFPNADFKIYLEASKTIRAKRRYNQLIKKGFKADYEKILSSIIERDKTDTERKIAPLKKTDKSYCINTSNLTIESVVNKIMTLVNCKTNS